MSLPRKILIQNVFAQYASDDTEGVSLEPEKLILMIEKYQGNIGKITTTPWIQFFITTIQIFDLQANKWPQHFLTIDQFENILQLTRDLNHDVAENSIYISQVRRIWKYLNEDIENGVYETPVWSDDSDDDEHSDESSYAEDDSATGKIDADDSDYDSDYDPDGDEDDTDGELRYDNGLFLNHIDFLVKYGLDGQAIWDSATPVDPSVVKESSGLKEKYEKLFKNKGGGYRNKKKRKSRKKILNKKSKRKNRKTRKY